MLGPGRGSTSGVGGVGSTGTASIGGNGTFGWGWVTVDGCECAVGGCGWLGGGGGSTGRIGMSVIRPSTMRAGRSIFALITAAITAT